MRTQQCCRVCTCKGVTTTMNSRAGDGLPEALAPRSSSRLPREPPPHPGRPCQQAPRRPAHAELLEAAAAKLEACAWAPGARQQQPVSYLRHAQQTTRKCRPRRSALSGAQTLHDMQRLAGSLHGAQALSINPTSVRRSAQTLTSAHALSVTPCTRSRRARLHEARVERGAARGAQARGHAPVLARHMRLDLSLALRNQPQRHGLHAPCTPRCCAALRPQSGRPGSTRERS